MSSELEEFRQKLIAHAKMVTNRAPKIESEASTNISLVLPFLSLLGYDITNPDEVSPEHRADFSDKYQNKVDYAILNNGSPVIAIEAKCVGSQIKDDRGQLKSYFNACKTIKLGVLTDGLKYEFYADSDSQNMMDDTAFFRFDFSLIAKSGAVDENTLSGIATIRNGSFNPENVGAEAKSKILFESIINTLKKFKSDPSDDFVRFILGLPEVGGKIKKITQKTVDSSKDIIRNAIDAFVAQEAIGKFGYAPKDVVKTAPERPEIATPSPVSVSTSSESDGEICPTDGEKEALDYTRNRLFYLVRNDVLFQEVQKISFKKGKTSFRVYYLKPNNGSLYDYKCHKDGRVLLQFPALNDKEIEFKPSPELDESLLCAFTQRVKDAGVAFETATVLRKIEGGQSA